MERLPIILCLAVAVWLAELSVAFATVIVVPGSQENSEGNGNQGFPFNTGASSTRYQQVFEDASFSTLGGPVWLTAVTFRPDASAGAVFSGSINTIQLNLSTSANGPDSLSSTFSSNVGADDTTVFNGTLSLSSAFTGPGGGPKDFDITVTFATPFYYDNSAGHLLLDIRNFSGGNTTEFDAHDVGGDEISRALTITTGVNSPTAEFVGSGGLVAQFTAVTVPEPSAISLLLLGFCCVRSFRQLRPGSVRQR